MKGVLQGETASPTLFNLFIDGIVNVLEASNVAGIRLQTQIVHILLYADDMVIVAPSRETLQMKITLASNFLIRRGLKVNMNKTKVMIFRNKGRLSKQETFSWRGEKCEIVSNYCYLGVSFYSSGIFNLTAKDFADKGVSAQGAVLCAIKKNPIYNSQYTRKLFNSIVASTSLYGSGIWGLNQMNAIEKVQQKFFKRILNLPTSTPGYFIRLESGQHHTSLDILKNALIFLKEY